MKTDKKVSGTTEWASHNKNYINGCSNDCKYCYAKAMAIRFNRKTVDNWHIEEVNSNSLNARCRKENGTIMFPSSHDITPVNLNNSISFLEKLLSVGNKVLIVSKPHFEVIEAICDRFCEYRGNILFRFTIGSTNSEILKFWEPNAPDYEERKECLIYAFNSGFNTSVSCEPMLDNHAVELVSELDPYVTDAIWIGKVNRLNPILNMNGFKDTDTLSKTKELLSFQTDDNIKRLYLELADNPKIKWKESIKKVVGLEISTVKGLDM
jgi:DNA repair photolyase